MIELRVIVAVICFAVWAVFVALNVTMVFRMIVRRSNDSIVPLFGMLVGFVGLLISPIDPGVFVLALLVVDGSIHAIAFAIGFFRAVRSGQLRRDSSSED